MLSTSQQHQINRYTFGSFDEATVQNKQVLADDLQSS